MTRKGIVILGLLASLMLAIPGSLAAKKARLLNVTYPASMNGTAIDAGVYRVSLETHSPEVVLTFKASRDGNVVATVQGRFVDRGVRYNEDAIVYDRKPDGSRIITEIRFAATSQAIVFGEPTSTLHPLGQEYRAPSEARSSEAAPPSSKAQRVRFLGKPRRPPAIQSFDNLGPLLELEFLRARTPLMPAPGHGANDRPRTW